MGALFTKDGVLRKLEAAYWRALNGGKLGNLHVALQVIGLQGKHVGMFEKQLLPREPRVWKPADTPYPERKNPAGGPVLGNHPHPEREKPPPVVGSAS